MPQQLFVFIQLEYPWALGPAEGRYLIRRSADGEPERVVVLGALEAGRQSIGAPPAPGWSGASLLRRARRGRSMPTGPEPAPVATTRVTVIDPVSLAADNQARAWLAEHEDETALTPERIAALEAAAAQEDATLPVLEESESPVKGRRFSRTA